MNVTDYDVVAKSFDPALITEVVTFTKETTSLRLAGGVSEMIGRYWFCCVWPVTPSGQRIWFLRARYWTDASGLATPPGNLREYLALAKLPAGTTAIIGTVADNFPNQLGRFEKSGNTQIFVPHVKTFPFEKCWLAGELRSASQMAVQLDDRVLWASR